MSKSDELIAKIKEVKNFSDIASTYAFAYGMVSHYVSDETMDKDNTLGRARISIVAWYLLRYFATVPSFPQGACIDRGFGTLHGPWAVA